MNILTVGKRYRFKVSTLDVHSGWIFGTVLKETIHNDYTRSYFIETFVMDKPYPKRRYAGQYYWTYSAGMHSGSHIVRAEELLLFDTATSLNNEFDLYQKKTRRR